MPDEGNVSSLDSVQVLATGDVKRPVLACDGVEVPVGLVVAGGVCATHSTFVGWGVPGVALPCHACVCLWRCVCVVFVVL